MRLTGPVGDLPDLLADGLLDDLVVGGDVDQHGCGGGALWLARSLCLTLPSVEPTGGVSQNRKPKRASKNTFFLGLPAQTFELKLVQLKLSSFKLSSFKLSSLLAVSRFVCIIVFL